jgi:hypothetical protein
MDFTWRRRNVSPSFRDYVFHFGYSAWCIAACAKGQHSHRLSSSVPGLSEVIVVVLFFFWISLFSDLASASTESSSSLSPLPYGSYTNANCYLVLDSPIMHLTSEPHLPCIFPMTLCQNFVKRNAFACSMRRA